MRVRVSQRISRRGRARLQASALPYPSPTERSWDRYGESRSCCCVPRSVLPLYCVSLASRHLCVLALKSCVSCFVVHDIPLPPPPPSLPSLSALMFVCHGCVRIPRT